MARNDKVEIWLIEDANDCHDRDGNAVPFYVFVNPKSPDYFVETVKRRDGKLATLEQLARLCDHDAENINAHDFVGAHRLLGAVLYRQFGREKATEIMLDIAERRGLHGMNGVCGTRDSYADLGVGESGRDWDGGYGD